MPLRIKLKPSERLIINGASIRNGDRPADFLVETTCRFLRESEIVHESEADTPCKKLCVTLQIIHLSEDCVEVEKLFFAQAKEVIQIMPGTAAHISDICDALSEKQTHRAIKIAKQLVDYEYGERARHDRVVAVRP